MGLFRRKRLPLGPPAHNPLLAVPLPAAGVEAGVDPAGLVQIRSVLRPHGRVRRIVARLFRYHYQRRVNLDERGSFFWSQVDGAKDLNEIARALAHKFDLSTEESRRAALLFTRSLMLRQVLCLRVPEDQASAPSTESLVASH